MNTPSHFLLHAWLRKYFWEKKNFFIPKSFLLWAIAPDIGLYLCVFLYALYSEYFLWNPTWETFRYMFDVLYFEHPLWIFAYNFLHSPLVIVSFLCVTKFFKNYLGAYYIIMYWFFIWCLLHTFFDIPLHHNDGPRIFYPISDYIFYSPVSYWNREYYAGYVIPVELWMCVIMILYLYIFPLTQKFLWKK